MRKHFLYLYAQRIRHNSFGVVEPRFDDKVKVSSFYVRDLPPSVWDETGAELWTVVAGPPLRDFFYPNALKRKEKIVKKRKIKKNM